MTTDVQDRIALRPDEAARVTGLCRDTIFRAISSGELRSSRIGKARLITMESLREFIARHEQAGANA